MVKSLSVFFPAYNEEGNIRNTVEKAIAVLKTLDLKWEIIIIDDGSKDKTGQIADELVEKYSQVRAVHQPNGGYGAALRAGFANSTLDWVTYTDGDGQFDFAEITNMLAAAENADVVWGYRIKRNDPFYRLLFAKGWTISLWLLLGLNLKDPDCGFKLFKKSVVESIMPLESRRGAMINAELAAKAQNKGFLIAQVGVHHYPRVAGKPTGANLQVIIKSYLDLLKLWWKLQK